MPTVNMPAVKCLLNSVVSTEGAKFITIDISDFYLSTPMERNEYMHIPTSAIPDCIMTEYNLEPLVHNGFVLVKLCKRIYGLPQAGLLANLQLKQHHLADNDYHPVANTASLYQHKTHPITFSLYVDDFGVKYVGKESVQHLEQVLKQKYCITSDWSGTLYVGLTLQWNYKAQTVDLSMPGYVAKALK
jgi:hypothetical protein